MSAPTDQMGQASPGTGARAPGSSAATRHRTNRWRDPRLVVGTALVALSVLVGAAVFRGADDTVTVWAARHDLSAGQHVTAGDLVRREVRFGEQSGVDRYVSARAVPDVGAVLHRDVGAGELLPRAALQGPGLAPLTQVPLSVPADAVPASVQVGTVVDVWVTPDQTDVGASPDAKHTGNTVATLVFDDVRVVGAPERGTSLGPSSTRQVVVGVGQTQADRLPRAIAALGSGTVLITRES
ncbi:MAG: hypothetical protein ACRDPB_10665 [Nocardioidaceae bacterium]